MRGGLVGEARRLHLTVPMANVLATTALLLAIAPPALFAAPAHDRWNRNCREEEDGKLNNDTYRGTFEKTATARGPLFKSIALSLSGPFEVTVDELGTITSTTGRMNFAMSAGGADALVRPTLDMTDSGAIDRVAAQTATAGEFVLVATLDGQAKLGVTAPGRHTELGLGSSADIRVEFLIDQVSCDQASGHVISVPFNTSLANLRAAGYEVDEQPGTWTARTGGKSAKQQAELQQKLDEASKPLVGAFVRPRALIAADLGKIMDDILRDKDAGKLGSAMFTCLYRQWSRHTDQVITGWVDADARRLIAYTGLRDPSVLGGLINRALDADRTVSLLGLDTCHQDVQERLFDAINKSLSAQLEYVVSTGGSAQDLLGLLRKVSLIGQVAPELRKRVEDRIQEEAWKLAKRQYASFRAVRGATGCPAAATRQWRIFLAALREYQILGGENTELPSADDTAWGKQCTGF